MNKRIFNYSCWLLARRRYSILDFQKKLSTKFPEQKEETDEILNLFIKRKYLDDEEYTRLYIRDQLARKPQGMRMIKQKLSQKGIKTPDIASIMESENLNEYELARGAVQKKLKTLKAGSPLQQKQKLYNFLVSRGFGYDTIMKALKE